MASRFWIGGTGSWDQATTTHWSTTSGGAGGASVPTIADDTIFDASSGGGTVTVTATAPCLSFNAAAFTGNFTFSAGLTVTGGGNVALPTAGVTTSGSFGITMQGGAAQTITFNGSTIGSGLAIGNASTDKVTIQDTCHVGGTVTLNRGTLDANGQTCTWGTFASNNANVRAMTIGTSNITLTGANTVWDVSTSTNMTQTAAATSTVTSTGSNAIIRGTNSNDNNVQFYNVTMTGVGTPGLFYCKVNNNFTRTGTAVKTDGVNFTEVTVGGTFTLTGNSVINRLTVISAHGVTAGAPTPAIVTAAAVSLTNADFMDIQAAGAAIPWTGTSLGDALGNSNITFTTPVAQTWSGNTTGNWSTLANWTSRVPLPQDNVAITGLTSGTITADMPRMGANIDFTGSTGGTITLGTAGNFFGSLTLAAGMTNSVSNTWQPSARSAQTITTGGVALTGMTFTAPGATYTLQDNLAANATTRVLQINSGTLNANGFNVTYGSLVTNVSTANRGQTMGSGTWTMSGTGTVWAATSTANTVLANTSTIIISDTSSTAKTFTGGGLTYNNLQINGAVSAAAVTVTGANFFNKVTGAANAHLTLPSSTITTINSLVSNGSAGNLFVLDASTAGTAATLKSWNPIATDFISVKDSTASQCIPFYAGANGTLVSGDTNWSAIANPNPTNQGATLGLVGVG